MVFLTWTISGPAVVAAVASVVVGVVVVDVAAAIVVAAEVVEVRRWSACCPWKALSPSVLDSGCWSSFDA